MDRTRSAHDRLGELALTLTGHGFNYYKAENRARADDLLVREQAAGALSQAATAVSALHSAYRLRFLPPPTRDNPFPPAEDARCAAAILALRDRLEGTASLIRGMPVPTQDKIWKRFRQERDLLEQLVNLDLLMIEQCADIRAAAQALAPDVWRDQDAGGSMNALLQELEGTIRERQSLLTIV
jgi:hypothetical protein